ncbi:MAG: hypothetical protein R2991_06800 [Thermoanaerobaculia bacterium]
MSARACCRVDLAGGTLDIWPLGLLHEGARTINVAVDLEARVSLEASPVCRVEQGGELLEASSWRELAGIAGGELVGLLALELALPPAAVRLHSDSPRGGGLGGSSALGVALVAAAEAWTGAAASDPHRRAALVRDVEARLMGLPTGRQDQYAALYGGALEILYRPGGEVVSALPVDLEILGRSLVVAYTGRSHFSAGSNWEVIRRRLDGDRESVDLFTGIATAACDVAEALRDGDIAAAGRAVGREWSFRRRLAEGVSSAEIEALLAAAARAGAWGGKATGAGGGGCVAVLAPPERREAVASVLESGGARVLDCRPSARPVTVEDAV